MAVRLKKLAKELNYTPETVISLLHALGYQRFRKPSDMISDTVITKFKQALRQGVVQADRAPPPVRTPPVARPTAPRSDLPLDGSIEQWVAQTKGSAPAAPGSNQAESLAQIKQAHDQLRQAHASLQAEHDQLRQAHASLQAEHDQLLAKLSALQSAKPPGYPTLGRLLQARGLPDSRAREQAIQALLNQRAFANVLDGLMVAQPDAVRALLADRLVLVTASDRALDVPGLAKVVVDDAHAELPSPSVRAEWFEELAEVALLSGIRRLALVGGPPVWLRLLRNQLDNRIQVSLRAEADPQGWPVGVDAVLLWAVPFTAQARQAVQHQPVVVAHCETPELPALTAALRQALAEATR